MKRTIRIICIVTSFLLMGSMLFAAGAQEKAPKEVSKVMEEKVSLYASITAIEPILAAFQEDTGVLAENTRLSTSKFASTVLTEFQAGKLAADVVQAPLPVMEILKSYGVIEDYFSPAAQSYPE